MKKQITFILFILLIQLMYSCSSPQYFHDKSSYNRQKELQNSRSANITSDIALGILSVFSEAALDIQVNWYPSEQKFKRINLINPTSDTMYVNMLTDVFWDEFNYCDFMDIRIPPNLECKVLVPINATYNLYYSNTPQSNDDELLEIFTSELSKISLAPGITARNDTIQ